MKNSNKIFFILFILLFGISIISASYTRSFVSSTLDSATLNVFTENSLAFDKSMCQSGTDFILQIVPLSCEPIVVRSDLLEENDVPVLCQIGATKINPLVDVDAIETMTITLDGSAEGIKAISYLRSESALGLFPDGSLSRNLLNNLGYVVIVLERNSNESSMPDFISGYLTAKIKYDVEGAWGVGDSKFLLPQLNNYEWAERHEQYGFWDGKGYLRAESVEADSATISVYADATTESISGEESQLEYTSRSLNVGEESSEIYLPGFSPCLASFTLKLNGIEYSDTKVRLKINSDTIEVTENEKFLNEKCYVRSIEKRGLYQSVKIHCTEDDKSSNFELSVSPKIKLNIDGIEGEYEAGDLLYTITQGSSHNSVYLGYVGSSSQSDDEEDIYIALIYLPETSNSKLDLDTLNTISDYVKYRKKESDTGADALNAVIQGFTKISALTVNGIRKIITLEDISIVSMGESKEFKERRITIQGFSDGSDYISFVSLNSGYKEPYENAINDFSTVINSYSDEKENTISEDTLGERSLFESIKLSKKLRMNKDVLQLCDEFMKKYPESIYKDDLNEICNNPYFSSSSGIVEQDVLIEGDLKTISFQKIINPSFEEYGARVIVKNMTSNNYITFDLEKDEKNFLSEVRGEELGEYFKLVSITEDSVNIYFSVTENFYQRTFKTNTETLELNNEVIIGGYSFTLKEIHSKKIASVSINPIINNQYSSSTFPFKIGIEKRAFQLSDEQISDKIQGLDKTIEDLQNTVDFLKGVVEIGNTVCTITGGYLTIKNLINNINGKSTARTTVMQQEGGWNEKCKLEVARGQSDSLDKCFLKYSGDIDKEVNLYTNLMKNQDEISSRLEEASMYTYKNEEVLDKAKYMEKYSEYVKTGKVGTYSTVSLSSVLQGNYYILNGRAYQKVDSEGKGIGDGISIDSLDILLSGDSWDKNIYSENELSEIDLYKNILGSTSSTSEQKNTAKIALFSLLSDLSTNGKDDIAASTWASQSNINPEDILFVRGKDSKTYPYAGKTCGNSVTNIPGCPSETPVAFVVDENGNKYVLVLDNSIGGKSLPVKAYYDSNGNKLDKSSLPNSIESISSFEKYDASSYSNTYLNPEIRYFDKNIYNGYPALVPFDRNKGWYIAPQSYYDSGAVKNFYLCNVGSNGLEESISKDMCRFFEDPVNNYEVDGLSINDVKSLINEGKDALSKAQKANKNSAGKVCIDRNCYDIGVPETGLVSTQCQDLMSPKDCSLLFNVCDPFVCPSSRCDLGGNYPVNDVVQSGVIGSIMLCYPNAKWKGGDNYVPICVSGVQAGLDNWLQITKSYRDCLQEQLDSGEVVGICDEIQSVYLCELFWSEMTPILKLGLPAVIGAIVGEKGNGGGEYENIQSALDTTKSSINYFKQYYAANAYNAFKMRSTSEIGATVCSTFQSVVAPSSVDLLDSLTQAQSPVQFTGKFEENTLTTRTNPPLSHYKVFYHIYAGQNSGAYYQVYLKGEVNSGSSYYMDLGVDRIIASGYINAGESEDQTIDKQFPSGYKQLCIIVNGQEECGFQKVSTSFAINYYTDYYVSQQASQTDIKTTQECTDGTSSWNSILLNMNAQETAEDLLNPDIGDLGLVRVCATSNPGGNTESSNWVRVGYCDDTKIGCWLDKNSVSEIIKAQNLEDSVISTTTTEYIEELFRIGSYLTDNQFKDNITKAQDTSKSNEERILIINNMLEKLFWNSQKALAYFVRGKIYADSIITQSCPDVCGEDGNVYYQVSDPETGVCEATTLIKEICPNGCYLGICNSMSISGENEEMPIFDYISSVFELDDGRLLTKDMCYIYSENLWYWANSCSSEIELPTQSSLSTTSGISVTPISEWTSIYFSVSSSGESPKSTEIINALKKKTYLEGLEVLINKVKQDEDYSLKTITPVNSVEFIGEEFFRISVNGELLKLVYINNAWKWGDDLSNKKSNIDWKDIGDISSLDYEERMLLNNVNGKSFIQGSGVIFDFKNLVNEMGISSSLNKELSREAGEGVYDPESDTLTEKQKSIYNLAETCEDCTAFPLLSDYCNEKLCNAIGTKTKLNCIYDSSKEDKCRTSGISTSGDLEDSFEKRDLNKFVSLMKYLSSSVSDTDYKCYCGEDCEEYAEWIAGAASAKGISDELLLLAIMIQESTCKSVASSGGDIGLMQINANVHCGTKGLPSDLSACKNLLLEDKEENINIGAQVLSDSYRTTAKTFSCAGSVKTYSKWEAALRGYNGWGCTGNDNYVEEVEALYFDLIRVYNGKSSTYSGSYSTSSGSNTGATTASSSNSITSTSTTSSDTFSNIEKEVIANAKSCKDCGDEPWYYIGVGNLCDEKECSAIASKLNKNCVFTKTTVSGNCEEVKSTSSTNGPCPSGTTYAGKKEGYYNGVLTEIDTCFIGNSNSLDVNVYIAQEVLNLISAAKKAGYDFSTSSGFRTMDEQIQEYDDNCVPELITECDFVNNGPYPSPQDTIVDYYNICRDKVKINCNPETAVPGYSNHQMGFAIDFQINNKAITSDSGAFKWLSQNAATYGLKNYPAEPWHWSVNGH